MDRMEILLESFLFSSARAKSLFGEPLLGLDEFDMDNAPDSDFHFRQRPAPWACLQPNPIVPRLQVRKTEKAVPIGENVSCPPEPPTLLQRYPRTIQRLAAPASQPRVGCSIQPIRGTAAGSGNAGGSPCVRKNPLEETPPSTG